MQGGTVLASVDGQGSGGGRNGSTGRSAKGECVNSVAGGGERATDLRRNGATAWEEGRNITQRTSMAWMGSATRVVWRGEGDTRTRSAWRGDGRSRQGERTRDERRSWTWKAAWARFDRVVTCSAVNRGQAERRARRHSGSETGRVCCGTRLGCTEAATLGEKKAGQANGLARVSAVHCVVLVCAPSAEMRQ
ncbi:hypothetical protein TRVL_03804 [Trypanosoma vivax]|nr:hypothetical protein TRVL_03804 [Trypanosoma vivax]